MCVPHGHANVAEERRMAGEVGQEMTSGAGALCAPLCAPTKRVPVPFPVFTFSAHAVHAKIEEKKRTHL